MPEDTISEPLIGTGQKKEKDTKGFRQDVVVWFAGMVFIIALIGAIFGLGHLRGWNAQPSNSQNESESSEDMLLPERYDPSSLSISLSKLLVWLCYIGHQLTIWSTIYYAQKKKINKDHSEPKYSSKISRIQWVPLLLNTSFHLLHLAQTHTTYITLDLDVTVASPESAVIMLLVLILLMESRDRGLAFGWPAAQHTDRVSRKLRFTQGPINIVRKYHGYAFSWAIIYTFWFEPMENTWGHVLGFLHTWMLMLQGSLMYTNVHLNRLWRFTLEAWAVIHSAVVAKQDGGPEMNGTSLWPMFCFGFLWVTVMTQMFGFSFWKKLPSWTRVFPFLVYMGVCVWCYSWIPDRNGIYYVRLPQDIFRVPAIQYFSVIYAWLILEIFSRIEKKLHAGKSESEKNAPLRPAWETCYILCFMLLYVLMILLSHIIHHFNNDLQLNRFVQMVILILVFLLGTEVSFMILKRIMKPKRSGKAVPTSTSYGAIAKEEECAGRDDNKGFADHTM